MNVNSRYSRFENEGKLSVIAEEINSSSEQKVYDSVMKQAALLKQNLKSSENLLSKPNFVLPVSVSLLDEAYGEIFAEHSKTYYLGTSLMTPERQRAFWAISGDTFCLKHESF